MCHYFLLFHFCSLNYLILSLPSPLSTYQANLNTEDFHERLNLWKCVPTKIKISVIKITNYTFFPNINEILFAGLTQAPNIFVWLLTTH